MNFFRKSKNTTGASPPPPYQLLNIKIQIIRIRILRRPRLERVKVATLVIGADAAQRRIGQALHGLAQRVDAVRDVAPVVELLAAVVLLVEAGAEDGLFAY